MCNTEVHLLAKKIDVVEFVPLGIETTRNERDNGGVVETHVPLQNSDVTSLQSRVYNDNERGAGGTKKTKKSQKIWFFLCWHPPAPALFGRNIDQEGVPRMTCDVRHSRTHTYGMQSQQSRSKARCAFISNEHRKVAPFYEMLFRRRQTRPPSRRHR